MVQNSTDEQGDPRGPRDGRLAPPSMLRLITWAVFAGGVLTWITIIAPHSDRTYDRTYVAIGALLVVFGCVLVGIRRRITPGPATVHVTLVVFGGFVLWLAWLGMRDLGGIQVSMLVILLGITASLGPGWWTMLLAAIMSAAYAVVLATSADIAGFDKLSQWQVVTIALLLAAAFHGLVRRELDRSHALDAALRRERDHERELHAQRLERLNQSLQETSDLKSSFVAMASHELRTPLTSIEGFATTMQDRWEDLSDSDKRSFVGVIDAQAKRLGRLVGDLLTVSRIEAGRVVARPEPTTLCSSINEVLGELDLTDDDVQVVHPADPPKVIVDPDHLQQMLLNYLSNALAYGAPPLQLEVHEEERTVRIEVADRGAGVDPEFAPRLFDRFSQAPEAHRNDDTTGTGLGLSIVRGLAEANGGEAWYEPNEPSGSRFCLRLPLAP